MTLELINKIQNYFLSDKKRIIPLVFFLIILIIISTISVHQNFNKQNINKTINQGRNIIATQVRPHLKTIGFIEKDSLIIDHDYLLVFTKVKDNNSINIISKITNILKNRNLIAGKLNLFPDNKGFSLSVMYKNIDVGKIAFFLLDTLKVSQTFKNNIIDKPGKLNKPRLAIVIDDFGYSSGKTARELINLDVKITISIIPGHQYTQWAIDEGLKHNKEIIVHMPMEPEKENLIKGEEEFILTTNSTNNENRLKLLKAIESIPQAVGLNNHMGSKATTDKELMTIVAQVIKDKNLYFLDSITSAKSVAFDICNTHGIPSLKRSVFIDHEKNDIYIENQLNKAINIAKEKMTAIALGHVNNHTIKVIKKMLENGDFDNISLCFASEIIK